MMIFLKSPNLATSTLVFIHIRCDASTFNGVDHPGRESKAVQRVESIIRDNLIARSSESRSMAAKSTISKMTSMLCLWKDLFQLLEHKSQFKEEDGPNFVTVNKGKWGQSFNYQLCSDSMQMLCIAHSALPFAFGIESSLALLSCSPLRVADWNPDFRLFGNCFE